MAAFLPSDGSDLESESGSEIAESDDESDITVSSVNTEDLSELDFSEDDEDDGEIGWSRDRAPVNVTPFTAQAGAVSGVAEDGSSLFPMKCLTLSWKKQTVMLDSALHESQTQSGKTQAVKKCKPSLVSTCCSDITTFPRHLCIGPKMKPLELHS